MNAANPTTSLAVTMAFIVLAQLRPIAMGRLDDPPLPPPMPTISIDEESSATAFDRGASTLDFLRYVQAKKLAIGDLVVASRVLDAEIVRDKVEANARCAEIKDAAGKAKIKIIRLAIVLGRNEPSVAAVDLKEQDRAINNHLEQVRRATLLGATQVSFPISSSGFYDDQRDAAKRGILKLWDEVNKAKLDCDLLITNGAGLPSSANFLGQVIQGVYKERPACQGTVGVLLELAKLDYSPRNAFLELTREIVLPTPAEVKEIANKASKDDPKVAKDDPKVAKDDPAVTKDAPKGTKDSSFPRKRPTSKCLVKAIAFEAHDKKKTVNGGPSVDIPGLEFLDRDLLDCVDFRGDLSIRYSGVGPLGTGLEASRGLVEDHFRMKPPK